MQHVLLLRAILTKTRLSSNARRVCRVMGVEGLRSCILRPAIVYGVGDRKGLMSRAVCAATYIGTGEAMKFLWDGALRMNTVHVEDVCRAVLHAGKNREAFEGKVYNLADEGDSDQQR